MFKNFAMMIPTDIERLPSGTPLVYVSEQDKDLFIEWFKINFPTIQKLSLEEIQGVYKYWKQLPDKNKD